MVKEIQEFIKVLNTSFSIYTSTKETVGAIQDANDALDQVGQASFNISSSLEWDELNTNMTTILSKGPDVSEKNDVLGAFSILVLRGKALLNAQDSANQLARDIYNQQRLQALSKAQQDRLDAMTDKLAPANLPKLDPSTLIDGHDRESDVHSHPNAGDPGEDLCYARPGLAISIPAASTPITSLICSISKAQSPNKDKIPWQPKRSSMRSNLPPRARLKSPWIFR